MQPVNVEIKAKCPNPAEIEKILKTKNARFVGEDHQIDTYFNVNKGRLKLREGTIENNLIAYHRSNQAGPKQSDICLYPSTDASSLKATLTSTLGIKVVVDKKRKIYFIDNVKFHVDQVIGLGSFVEIEAIDRNRKLTIADLQQQCELYMKLLNIQTNDLVEVSYSDLLMLNESKENIKTTK